LRIISVIAGSIWAGSAQRMSAFLLVISTINANQHLCGEPRERRLCIPTGESELLEGLRSCLC
jgi:hypothetical protein